MVRLLVGGDWNDWNFPQKMGRILRTYEYVSEGRYTTNQELMDPLKMVDLSIVIACLIPIKNDGFFHSYVR